MQQFSLNESPFAETAKNKEYYKEENEVVHTTFNRYGKLNLHLSNGEVWSMKTPFIKQT